MPNLSDKGVYLPPSPIRKLVPYAEKAKSRGIKVYHLNIGQPDICTPQVAVDAVKNISDHVFEYGHSAGNESYRRKLVKYYESVGIDVTADDLMITVGGSEAIFMAMTICLNPGRRGTGTRTVLRQLQRLRDGSGREYQADLVDHRQRLRTASDGGFRTADYAAHQSDSDLQPEQPDRIRLFRRGVRATARYRAEARPVPDGGRSIPRILLRRDAMHLGNEPQGNRTERGNDRLGVETLQHVRRTARNARIAQQGDHRRRAADGTSAGCARPIWPRWRPKRRWTLRRVISGKCTTNTPRAATASSRR